MKEGGGGGEREKGMMKRKTQEKRTSVSNDRCCEEGESTPFVDTFKVSETYHGPIKV